MSTLVLHQTTAPLLPATLAQALLQLGARVTGARTPRGTMRGQTLRLALDLSLDDDACAALALDFQAQGARVRASAHGPGDALLVWAFHALAAKLACGLTDGETDAPVDPRPDVHRDAAVAYLAAYEAEVHADRRAPEASADDGRAFVAWLAREEHVAVADAGSAAFSELSMNDAPALYEQLLESDAVDDVFVSERELVTLLARFRARRTRRA